MNFNTSTFPPPADSVFCGSISIGLTTDFEPISAGHRPVTSLNPNTKFHRAP